MELQVKAHNVTLSDDLRDYIERRAAKLDRVQEPISDARVELREQPSHRDGKRFTAQITIITKRAILRAEDHSTDIRAAVDLAVDRMNRRIKRFHDRKVHRGRRAAVNLGVLAVEQTDALARLESDDEDAGTLTRTKRFKIQPMDINEAIEQLELLGHDFFVFFNAERGNVNVLYRRKSGDYGVIDPELA